MDVAVLGPMRVRVGDDWIEPSSETQRRILGLLVLRVGHRVTTDELLDVVWRGDPPAGGTRTLRFHVSKLRDLLDPGRTLGGGPVVTDRRGYVLRIEPDDIDAHAFEAQAAVGRELLAAGDPAAARTELDRALSLWRGDAWPDLRYDDIALPAIRRLDEIRLSATEDRIEAQLALGADARLIAELTELSERHPLRERLWAQLIRALCDTGLDAAALEAYDRAAAILDAEVGARPSVSLQSLRAEIVEDSTLQLVDALRPDVLPARVSSFVGRTEELDRLSRLLRTHRLVTVTGLGGSGKTSLAVEAARAATDVIFVDLSDVDGERGVALRLASASRLAPSGSPGSLGAVVEQLAEAIPGDETLLVMDNCEHVVTSVRQAVDALLARVGSLRVLATSRTPIHASGEGVLHLGMLPVPGGDDCRDVESSDAVRMFVDRIAAFQADFRLDDTTSQPVAAICRRLHGLPLALELAAARLRVLRLDELLARLERPFDVLVDEQRSGERHRTLWGTISWSHDQLSPRAQILFRRMSVMRGEFDLEAIAAVCDGGDDGIATDVLAEVEELVDASLLERTMDPAGGFRMLATVREFATVALEDVGEVDTVGRRHAAYFAQRVAQRADGRGASRPVDVAAVRRDSENQAAALDRALARGDDDVVLRLASGLALDWYAVGPTSAATDRLRAIVASTDDESLGRATVLRELGLSLPWSGRIDDANAIADELDHIARRHRALDIEADAAWVRASIAAVAGDASSRVEFLERGLSILRAIDHPATAVLLFDLGSATIRRGDLDRSRQLTRELDREGRIRRDDLAIARVLLLRGDLALWTGDVSSAVELTTRALAAMRTAGFVGPQSDALRSVFDAAVALGDHGLAGGVMNDYEDLVRRNNEAVVGSIAATMQARLAVELGDDARSADRLASALASIHRTEATVGLADALLVAAMLADRRGRHDLAARIVISRSRRLADRGLVDPVPTQRRLARILPTDRQDDRHASWISGPGWRELVDLATDATMA
jgi:predicted ATPase/DNA-binding SARP family transcriptional activator